MKFRGHLLGGVAAGAVVAGIAVQTGVIEVSADSVTAFIHSLLSSEPGALAAGGIFLLTVLMSLFPDLDTASVPQRWFFRAAFAILVILLLLQRMETFAILTLVLLLPLLHRHRGWTHARLTPFAIAFCMMFVLGYLRTPGMFHSLSPDLLLTLLKQYWVVVLACVLGHYTHLVLDSR